jgi:MoaA/NifB/PqqE/SkfB family radical SAM enzyme
MAPFFHLPKYIYIFLTEQCNLHCTHCYGDFSSKEEIAVKEWFAILDKLIEAKVFYFVISGGEPTVYPNFHEVIKYLAERNQYFSIITNGIWNKKTEDEIIKHKEHIIQLKISLDGFDYETYNHLRNINSEIIFDQLVKRMKKLAELNFKIVLGINIHSKTINHVDKFCQFINALHPSGIQISTIVDAGRARNLKSEDKEYSLEQIESLERQFIENTDKTIELDFVDMPFRKDVKFGFSCPAMNDFWAIRSNGKLIPCPLFNEPYLKNICNFPDLKDCTLDEALQFPAFAEYRAAQSSPCRYNNKDCSYKKHCNRCIAQSLLNGGIYEPPSFCLQYESIFK